MNNRAQFFAVYLALITLFMVGLVLGMYIVQSQIVSNSFVSPIASLNFETEQDLAEMVEKDLILESGNRDDFCELFVSEKDKKLREFLFKDLSLDGVLVDSSALDEEREWKTFCESNYDFNFIGDKLVVKRKKIEKVWNLKSNKERINFPVKVVLKVGGEFEINRGEIE